ncbi:MAG: multidrug effflux MFS transporter [Rhodobiaceae bacterium]|nr:multidrug effflux MFS transporter [Rhodobiaceae bacterium]
MSRSPIGTIEFVALFSLLTAVTAASIDTMLPALGTIGEDLGIANPNDAQLVVSMFVLGMVFGDLFYGPVSDAHGRKNAIFFGLAIYAIGAVIAALAPSMPVLLAGRIIQGIGASGPKIAARALIRDQYDGNDLSRMMSLIMMVFILVPMLGPALGQLILAFGDWRMIFIAFVVLAVVNTAWLALRQPETLTDEKRIPLRIGLLVRNGWLILRHPAVMAYILATGFVFGGMLVYVGTSQAIFHELYGAGNLFALYFAILALGIGIASFTNSRLVMRVGSHRMAVVGFTCMVSCAILLLVAGWMSAGVPPFPVFMVLAFGELFSFGILFGNVNALAMHALGRVAGIGASILSSISSLVAVVMATVIGRFYDGTIMPLAYGFLIAGALSLVLVILAHRSRAGPI